MEWRKGRTSSCSATRSMYGKGAWNRRLKRDVTGATSKKILVLTFPSLQRPRMEAFEARRERVLATAA